MKRRTLLAAAGGALAGALPACASAPDAADPAPRYSALALQTLCDAVNQDKTVEDARARMAASIKRIGGQCAAAKGFLRTFNGTDLRLIVLPEYFLTGFPLGESREEWKTKAAIAPGGSEYEALSAIAQRFSIFLAGNVYETDANFPELYFQTNFVIDPSGDTVLRYRRLVSLYTPSPYDVWDAYLDAYGLEGVFPVAKTEIGNLAGVASEEILYPELTRAHALRGAEILIHPTSEVGAPGLTQKDIAKRARALENMVYVISANSAEIVGTPIPAASTDAMSKVVDFDGKVLAEAQSGESMNANAVIDLPALRARRRRTGMSHMLARQPLDAYRAAYAGIDAAAPNTLASSEMEERAAIIARQSALIDQMIADGVIR